MDILVTAFNRRNFDNVSPALQRCEQRGLSVKAVLFPNLSDPSSSELNNLPIPIVAQHSIHMQPVIGGVYHVEKQQEYRDLPYATLAALMHDVVKRELPRLIILTGCHRYPENAVFDTVSNMPNRPAVLGVQHGVHQRWAWYNERFAFDYLGLFGSSFVRHIDARYKHRLRLVGLPKLDSIKPGGTSQAKRYLLFCAQDSLSPNVVEELLCAISKALGLPVIIRVHPEHTCHLSELRQSFEFSAEKVPLPHQFESTAALITTGSTAALEALVAGIPTAVIDDGIGAAEYSELGIVAPPDPGSIIAVLSAQLNTTGVSTVKEKLDTLVVNGGKQNSEVFCHVLEALLGVSGRQRL